MITLRLAKTNFSVTFFHRNELLLQINQLLHEFFNPERKPGHYA
jgi:hypothetical protein